MNTGRPYNRSLLQGDDLDLVDFVHVTRDIPFNKLNQALNEHLNEVKRELTDLVNAEFHQFIALYSDIGASGTEEIEKLQLSLAQLIETVKAKEECVKGELEQVKELQTSLLASKDETQLMKEQRSLFVNMDYLESACKEGDFSMAPYHIAMVKSQLMSLIGKIPSASFISQRISQLLENTMTELEDAVRMALKAGDREEALALAADYLMLGREKDFEVLFVSTMVTPFLQATVTQSKLEELCTTSLETPGLVCLYNHVYAFLERIHRDWIALLGEIYPAGKPLALSLLVSPLLEKMMSDLSIIFLPGIPDAFQHSYVVTFQFIDRLLCLFASESNQIKGSPGWMKFQKQWQVNLYFQMRFREIATMFEESLDIQLPLLNFTKPAEYPISEVFQFKAIQTAVTQIWSGNVIIPPLLAKFFKMTIQTLARYIDWLVSIPAEFEGTELGLSIIGSKSLQLTQLKTFASGFFADTVLPQLREPTGVFKAAFDKFLETKWSDAFNYLESKAIASFVAFTDHQYSQVCKSCSAVLEHGLQFFSAECQMAGLSLPVLTRSSKLFASYHTQALEASKKTMANIRRLESVMKAPLSEGDKAKQDDHSRLFHFVETEGAALRQLAVVYSIDLSDSLSSICLQ